MTQTLIPSSAFRRRRLVLGGIAVPIALVGSLLCAGAAQAATTTVSSKSALNAAVSGAANGDVISLGQDLLGDGGVNDVLTVPGSTSVTLDLNGHELDVDLLDVANSSALFVTNGTGVDAALVVGGRSVSATDVGAAGVRISTSGRLEVQSSVHLTATGSPDRAGIGTVAGDDSFAVLYVNSGATVTATGGSHGAGIGGGAGAVPLSTISIGDADVTATGGDGAAGIGGGYGNPAGSTNLRIVNTPTATVTATGGSGAAGIGGGKVTGAGTGVGSAVTITDADVTVADGGLSAGAAAGTAAPSAIGGGEGVAPSASGSLVHSFTGNPGRRDALRIPAGATLTVPTGRSITNSGELVVSGTLTGAGTVNNTNGTIKRAGTGTIAEPPLTITGRNYTVAFDAAGGTTTAPATQHVYATTFANGGLDLAGWSGSNAGRALVGWTAARTDGSGTAQLTNADALADFATTAGGSSVTLTAVYVAAVTPATGGTVGGAAGGGTAGGTTGTTTPPATSGSTTTPGAAPTLPARRTTTVKLGHPLSLSVAATSGTPVTYSVPAKQLPSGIALDSRTGLLYGAPRTAGRFVIRITATNATGTASRSYTVVVPAATRVITGSVSAVTPRSGKPVTVTIRGLQVGERWHVAVDGREVRTGIARFPGSVKAAARLPKAKKDRAHVIRVSSDRHLADPSVVAAHELTVTSVAAKKALRLTRKGTTLTVRGLAAKERVTITRGATVIATGRADAKGVFVVRKKALKAGTHAATGSTKGRTDRLTVK